MLMLTLIGLKRSKQYYKKYEAPNIWYVYLQRKHFKVESNNGFVSTVSKITEQNAMSPAFQKMQSKGSQEPGSQITIYLEQNSLLTESIPVSYLILL